MTNSVGPEIAGALARFWAGGSGPTHASVNSAFALAGYEEPPSDANKQQRVLNAIRYADDDTAKLVVEELLNVLRSSGYFDPPGDFSIEDPKVESLRIAFRRRGYNLAEGGYADWAPQVQRQAPPPKAQAAGCGRRVAREGCARGSCNPHCWSSS